MSTSKEASDVTNGYDRDEEEQAFPSQEDDSIPSKEKVVLRRGLILLVVAIFLVVAGLMFLVGYLVGDSSQSEALESLTSPPPVINTASPTSPSPSESPTPAPTVSPLPFSNITVAVYYYPWHGSNFHGGQYLRHDLIPQQTPLLGEYDDSDPSVIARHLDWSRQSNIRAWVTSWWGPNRYEDNTIRNVILPHSDIGDLKIAVHYESTGRSKNSTGQLNATLILERAGPDVTYLCEHYFSHPNYMRIDDRPVVVFYLSRLYEKLGLMRETSTIMRDAAVQCGEKGIYLVGDHSFGSDILPLDYLDAVTNYDVYGSTPDTDGYAYQNGVDQYFTLQQRWRNRTQQQGVDFIPVISPGFNDRSVRLGANHSALSRKLSPDAPFGSLFEESLKQALKMVEQSTGNMLLVNSWNEWHEDSQIEPVIGFSSSQPVELSQGVEYEGYGFRYLDILRKFTVS